MPRTEAQKRANKKYDAKAYDQIKIIVRKGERDKIRAHAKSKELSLNSYIKALIENDMQSSETLSKNAIQY